MKSDDYIKMPKIDDVQTARRKRPSKYIGFSFLREPAAIRSRPLAYELVGTWRLDNSLLIRRSQQSMKQSELAAAAGISQTALSNIELGKSVPSVGTALVLAMILQEDVGELFCLTKRRERLFGA